jgi:hypothetical protein
MNIFCEKAADRDARAPPAAVGGDLVNAHIIDVGAGRRVARERCSPSVGRTATACLRPRMSKGHQQDDGAADGRRDRQLPGSTASGSAASGVRLGFHGTGSAGWSRTTGSASGIPLGFHGIGLASGGPARARPGGCDKSKCSRRREAGCTTNRVGVLLRGPRAGPRAAPPKPEIWQFRGEELDARNL